MGSGLFTLEAVVCQKYGWPRKPPHIFGGWDSGSRGRPSGRARAQVALEGRLRTGWGWRTEALGPRAVPALNQPFPSRPQERGQAGSVLACASWVPSTEGSFSPPSELAHSPQVDEMCLFSPLAGIH